MKKINRLILACALPLILSACGFIGQQLADKAGEERLLKPGALDLPLTGVNDTYQYNFMNTYRITHQWPRISNCSYIKNPVPGVEGGSTGKFYSVFDIYELDGHTWQAGSMSFEKFKRSHYVHPIYPTPVPTFDDYTYYLSFDRYVRSVKTINPVVYDKITGRRIEGASEVIEVGLQVLCHQSWYKSQHSIAMYLRKWSVDQYINWQQTNAPRLGQVSRQRRGTLDWTVLEFQLEPQPNNGGSSGPYQYWMLPVGETGYTFMLRLGANQESLKHPETHARMQTAFLRLIDSMKIEPIAR
jgi:hypothetical protein